MSKPHSLFHEKDRDNLSQARTVYSAPTGTIHYNQFLPGAAVIAAEAPSSRPSSALKQRPKSANANGRREHKIVAQQVAVAPAKNDNDFYGQVPREDLIVSLQDCKKKIRVLEDNTLHLKREVQKLESENVRLQRRIEQLLRLSEGGRSVSIPADVRRDIEKGILVRQLKNQINTLRDLVAEKENEIDGIKRDLKFNHLYELEREKDEYFREIQRLKTMVKDLKTELQREKQRREWNNKLLGANGGDELKKEVARLASGYQNILTNISFRHGQQVPNSVASFHPSSMGSDNFPMRPHSANSTSSSQNNHLQPTGGALFQKMVSAGFRSPVFEDPIDNFGVNVPTIDSETKPFSPNFNSTKPSNMLQIGGSVAESLIAETMNEVQNTSSKVDATSPLYKVGDRIEGKFRDSNDWYPASIKAFSANDGTYHLIYDDGDEEKMVPLSRIRIKFDSTIEPATISNEKPAQRQQPQVQSSPVKTAPIRQPKFSVGEKVNALYYNGSTPYPATIAAVISDGGNEFMYDLLYDDGDREKKVAEGKINPRVTNNETLKVKENNANTAAEKSPRENIPAKSKTVSEPGSSTTAVEVAKKTSNAYPVGAKVEGQYDGGSVWYPATVTAVKATDEDARSPVYVYDLLYEDGDTEQGVSEEEVRWRKSPESGADPGVAAVDGRLDTMIDLTGARTFLSSHDWPKGLQESFLENLQKISVRYFICDDSSSMNTEDGTKLIKVGKKYTSTSCSRWSEIGDCLKFHINLSRAAAAHSVFRFCNAGNPIVIGAHKGSKDLKKAEEDGYHTLMRRFDGHADGVTPLCAQVADVVAAIRAQEKELRSAGRQAVVIITSDGEATDGDIMRALLPLGQLPASLVIRLCTDDEKVVSYWNGLEALNVSHDLLDDLHREAEEVYRVNPWLTYAEPLHRVREFGVPHDVIDLLDRSLLSLSHLQLLTHLIFGVDLPDPAEDWTGFVSKVQEENRKNPQAWNPISRHFTDWIDVTALETCYSRTLHSNSSGTNRRPPHSTAQGNEGSRNDDEVVAAIKSVAMAVTASKPAVSLQEEKVVNATRGSVSSGSNHNDSTVKSTNLDNFLDQLSDDDDDAGGVGGLLDGGKVVTLPYGSGVEAKTSIAYEEDFD